MEIELGKLLKAVEFLDYTGSESVGIDGHSTLDGVPLCNLADKISVLLYMVAFGV